MPEAHTKTHAIRIDKTGGPEQMKWVEIDLPAPDRGEARLKNLAIGLNFIDTYHRTGLYPVALPAGLGLEASAIVEAVGEGVAGFKAGDRVAHGTGPVGAYAERRNFPADKLIRLPDAIDDRTAAAMMLQGMTVEYLIHRTFPVAKGDWVLLHAAAGGVGSIASQWLNHLGAQIIGTAGSPEKLALAKAQGCHHVVNYHTEDWVNRVKEITGGQGVTVVYDGVGKDVFMESLDCLKPRGTMVTFGNASGPVPEISPLLLSQKGSLFLTRPTLMAYVATRPELELAAGRVIEAITKGWVKIKVGHTYPLKEAAQAHRDLEARKTTGSVVLIP
ncbi:MAG: quinone oxidoreductase family protein [Dongiaceae bacterium]